MEEVQSISLAVDAVVFGYHGNQLQLLLIERKYGKEKGSWALPGGFVQNDEDLERAVTRELKEETGVNVNYFEQLYTFGAVQRDPRKRVVSVAYLALINPKNFSLSAGTDAQDASWFPIHNLPDLAFDHMEIVSMAYERLKAKLNYQPVGFELLNKEFPFSDLEHLYQCILNQQIDRRNFRKKILSFGFLEETEKVYQPKSGRPAKLFRFNPSKYKELTEKGIYLDFKFV